MIKKLIDDPEVLQGYSEDGAGTPLMPEYLARPESVGDIQELVKYCACKSIPITPTGARTCDTGSGLAERGLILSNEKRKKIIEINEDEGFCDVEPGIYLYDLKQEIKGRGFFYPPDPSSEKIATLGGTVATNAAGARSFKYGQTADHVIGLEVILADGSKHWVENYQGRKCTTGPASLQQLGRLFVGSEGIFGIFSKIRLRIYKETFQTVAICAFFETASKMHSFNRGINSKLYPTVSPRSLEFMDESCLNLIKNSGKFPQVPEKGNYAVILEQEFEPGTEEKVMESWLSVLEESGALVEDSIVADTDSKISELRELRHYPPSTIWEMGKKVQAAGGKKISTDWAVPVLKLEQMMKESEPLCKSFGFSAERVFRYAHLGDGHPHFNFVPENHQETEKALGLRRELSKLALRLGGTIAGEHGVGKFRKELFQLENTGLKMDFLRASKNLLDPKHLFSPGNLIV